MDQDLTFYNLQEDPLILLLPSIDSPIIFDNDAAAKGIIRGIGKRINTKEVTLYSLIDELIEFVTLLQDD